jgi:uncharacterized protein YjbI with pentapeptide repeats
LLHLSPLKSPDEYNILYTGSVASMGTAAKSRNKNMDQKESLELFAKGKDAWNAWADEMLAKKADMEKAGIWRANPKLDSEWGCHRENGENPETQVWLDAARSVFSGLPLGRPNENELCDFRDCDFRDFIFPGEADFRKARFKNVDFQGATFSEGAFFMDALFSGNAGFQRTRFSGKAGFKGATFKECATFILAKFNGDADFEPVTFAGGAAFWRATFNKTSSFMKSTFGGDADFKEATFSETGSFRGAAFSGDAIFESATFHGGGWFWGVTFGGVTAFRKARFEQNTYFIRAAFKGSVATFEHAEFLQTADFSCAAFHGLIASFEGARFSQTADFRAINVNVERAFDLDGARFAVLPDFVQAHFAQAPQLDDFTLTQPIENRGFWALIRGKMIRSKMIRSKTETCVDAPDQKRPDNLFRKGGWDGSSVNARYRALRRLAALGGDGANERLFLKGEIRSRRGVQDKPWGTAFWFWLAYDALSDFGCSVARPLIGGAIWTAVFATAYYLLVFSSGTEAPCSKDGWDRAWQAAQLALNNAVLLLSWDSATDMPKAEACLDAVKATSSAGFTFGLNILQLAQRLGSVAVWFLALLAVRRRFTIK